MVKHVKRMILRNELGVKQIEVPWVRLGSGFTHLFEAFMMEMIRHMPVKAVAE